MRWTDKNVLPNQSELNSYRNPNNFSHTVFAIVLLRNLDNYVDQGPCKESPL
jgi:hypothetical protein